MQTGRLIGVGVGPGDPELVTMRALRVLRGADRVVAPAIAVDAVGRAESILRHVAPELRVHRVVFAMVPEGAGQGGTTASGEGGAASGGADPRQASHLAAAEALLGWLDAGEEVAFVTLGDPNIYSTFSALSEAVRTLRPNVELATVPGITAFQELASRTGTVLLDGTESLSLVTALDGPTSVELAIADPDQAVVVYKGGRHLPAVTEALRQAGRLSGAVMGELMGLPGERVSTLSDMPEGPASYLATVIVPPVRRATEPTELLEPPASAEGATR
jgi:precorrin-2/cobalt-factor-2 C20-methyltransferase